MNGTSKCGETETIGFSAIHNLPNVVSHMPSNQCLVVSKERIPVLLKDVL